MDTERVDAFIRAMGWIPTDQLRDQVRRGMAAVGVRPPAEAQPVAYADPQAFAKFKKRGHLGGPHGREWMWAKPDAGLVPVYAHPPPSAPVRVERKHPVDGNGDDDAYNRGWNDCLDALTQQPAAAPVGVAEAWQEGYRQGVLDERTSEDNIGIAGFGAKVEPARNNPYALAQQPAAVDGVLAAVRAEVARATAKFPTWPTDPLHASGVVQEESGELAKAVLQAVYEPHKSTPEDAATEAFQTAAMAVRFLLSMGQYDWKPGSQHDQNALAAQQGGRSDD